MLVYEEVSATASAGAISDWRNTGQKHDQHDNTAIQYPIKFIANEFQGSSR